ncbi:phosphate/phosphite/phosphonate ABC transporter substrate-binding protein [Roseicyclus marinus]|uniref:phosphate/phosphite/phosphonate ABC transporter substrate-binding protein n=1 Tax=Roseicyclus marinus TaxID=2161673 RepID=UPI0024100280|nr:PhnD/SsuA/transferrin family substrate-binding protein [Roseicyclus marinus]MDG3040793.1 PhnD/SsuA/transferrin family substrate-binding protein [Roseicyclus marinus]
MIAALPMYDRPELRAETDALWAGIRDALRARAIQAPDTLTRDRNPWEIWQSPDLILAQTCGLPFRARLHPQVTLVATPDYALPGCPPGHYNSVILARDPALPDRPRVAVNDPLSQSGWAALHAWATARALILGPVTITGSHAASARALAQGHADLAAIDAQTWRHLVRFDGADPALEIARTPPTPGLPLITARGRDPAPLRAALAEALAALPTATRAALDLAGFVTIDAVAYRAIPIPPNP